MRAKWNSSTERFWWDFLLLQFWHASEKARDRASLVAGTRDSRYHRSLPLWLTSAREAKLSMAGHRMFSARKRKNARSKQLSFKDRTIHDSPQIQKKVHRRGRCKGAIKKGNKVAPWGRCELLDRKRDIYSLGYPCGVLGLRWLRLHALPIMQGYLLSSFVNRTKANIIESMANSKTSTKPEYCIIPKPNHHLRDRTFARASNELHGQKQK